MSSSGPGEAPVSSPSPSSPSSWSAVRGVRSLGIPSSAPEILHDNVSFQPDWDHDWLRPDPPAFVPDEDADRHVLVGGAQPQQESPPPSPTHATGALVPPPQYDVLRLHIHRVINLRRVGEPVDLGRQLTFVEVFYGQEQMVKSRPRLLGLFDLAVDVNLFQMGGVDRAMRLQSEVLGGLGAVLGRRSTGAVGRTGSLGLGGGPTLAGSKSSSSAQEIEEHAADEEEAQPLVAWDGIRLAYPHRTGFRPVSDRFQTSVRPVSPPPCTVDVVTVPLLPHTQCMPQCHVGCTEVSCLMHSVIYSDAHSLDRNS